MREIVLATSDDLSAMHGILSLCGEHMHRTQQLDHWYPFRSFEKYMVEVASADVYGIYELEILLGTFYVTPKMRSHYVTVDWADSTHKALYLGGLGILPMAQGMGLGRWAMEAVDALAKNNGYDCLRFDGVLKNTPLLQFYDKLGYQRRGELSTPRGTDVMTYERIF